MRCDKKSGMVIYRSRLHATLKRNYHLMPALKWLRMGFQILCPSNRPRKRLRIDCPLPKFCEVQDTCD
jgi:hypothetical protein